MKRVVLQIKNPCVVILVVVICSLPAIIAFLQPGFPRTDDGNWMIIRLSAFYESIRAGEFPVRWLSRLNFGYGYPVSNFLYPGFMYLGVPIAIVTSSFVTTVKVLFALSLIGSSVGMYLWLRGRFGQWASFIGAMMYLYSPYHLYDATVRGSLGEVLVLCMLPFVFWAIDRKSVGLTGLFLGFLLISHNTLAILFLPIIVLYQLLSPNEGVSNGRKWAGIMLGMSLSSFFWIPAIADLGSTVFSQVKISEWVDYFADFRLIGIVQFLVILISLFFIRKNDFRSLKNRVIVLFLIVSILSLFMSTVFSSFLWKHLPVQFIQFPFRVLSVTIFSSAFLGAWLFEYLPRRILFSLVMLVLMVISALPYILPSGYDAFEDGFYSTNQATTTIKNEYMPRWVREIPTTSTTLVTAQSAVISDISHKGSAINFTAQAQMKERILINQTYFPGWRVRIDNKVVPISYDNPHGVIAVDVYKGKQNVAATFEETPLRLFANVVSGLSLVILVGFLLRKIKI